jgi:MFS transporter, PAT family, beta-lactamase induction signal transducer AmpG
MLRAMSSRDGRLDTWRSLGAVFQSWRLLSVTLLSFSSGLPLGLVWIAIPTWMTRAGVDIKVVGLFTLAQAPWTFKFLWAPLMDRYPVPLLGRKRGWIAAMQIALAAIGLWLARVAGQRDAAWIVGALTLATALASATQDIAIDGYAVEVLRTEEHGLAVGARVALYRAAMFVAGGLAITVAAETSWALVNLGLALAYLPFVVVAWRAPEPEVRPEPPRSLREAVWGPFLGFLEQQRAVEILAFVVLFKLSDNLTQALTRPFLVKVGFNDFDVGVATATVALTATLVSTFLGGLLTQAVGLGPALWISGFLQVFSNLGYALVAQVGVNRLVMYGAIAFEMGASGLGNGAFGVLLLRLTQKRFSATQYALLSSLFSLPRVLSGPVAGLMADTIGWRDFYVLTVLAGVPGLVMLQRFAPWGVREPELHVPATRARRAIAAPAIALRAMFGGTLAAALGAASAAVLTAIRRFRAGRGFGLEEGFRVIVQPASLADWLTTAGVVTLGLAVGLATAAALAARAGWGERPGAGG